MNVKTRKKLIEVALPLDAINKASAREKSIRHGHPSTLHLWWARRPLAAARAVIFSQMVDDPSQYVDELRGDPKLKRLAEKALKERLKLWEAAKALAEKAAGSGLEVPEPGPEPTLDEMLADQERQRLFDIIERLVQWENTTNEAVLEEARAEIWQSWRRTCADNAGHPRAAELFARVKLPAFHDPFAGGGALPLEAQRLGLEAYASDLNPVAVLINKAMIEIPPKFAGQAPVNPEAKRDKRLIDRAWKGAGGLAEDVRYYGKWMREEAERRIGQLYPQIDITPEMAESCPAVHQFTGKKLRVIAWLWARTVKSHNPAFAGVDVPLASTFMLSTKAGKETFVEPVIEKDGYRFTIRVGKPNEIAKNGTKLSRGANFKCLMSGTPIPSEHIYAEANAGRMGSRLLAIVAEGKRSRVYLPPTAAMEASARQACPTWKPEVDMPLNARWFSPPIYGLTSYGDLFTPRQLVALTTFSDLIQEAREEVKSDALVAGLPDNQTPCGGSAYADAVALYLAFALSKSADGSSTLCRWMVQRDSLFSTFSRQALPMTWDFAEINLLADCTRSLSESIAWTAESIEGIAAGYGSSFGAAIQADATTQDITFDKVVSTDPPYYDNIGYADLSDFFYVWLRRSLKTTYPELFTTLVVPKAEELIASPYRHGGKEQAETFFLTGMTRAMQRLVQESHPAFPLSIYYAFKQSETDSEGEEGTSSTGWDTFLGAVIHAGFSITGTWPIRTERAIRSVSIGTNALASSIVLVCRPRVLNAPTATRREFLAMLEKELPTALAHLQRGNIAPVDLAQAAIGPGMAVYTRYTNVLDAEGKPLSVRDALAIINQTLDEALAEQEGDFDADSRWALTWFDQHGFDEADFGAAEQLSKAKNTSVAGLEQAGILTAGRGKVRILRPHELPSDWDPTTDPRLTTWEMVHHLIRALESGGESAAALIARKLGSKAETARELCYRLYIICERKKRATEALAYNSLVQSWPEITRLARELTPGEQGALFEVES